MRKYYRELLNSVLEERTRLEQRLSELRLQQMAIEAELEKIDEKEISRSYYNSSNSNNNDGL